MAHQAQTGDLTVEQISTFRETGYLVVPGMFTPQDMHEITKWTDEVQQWPEVAGGCMMYFERSRDRDQRILNRLENFVAYHHGFHDLVVSPRMAGSVSQLFGEPAVLFKDKINFKLPGGEGFTPHQDVQAGWKNYASIHITALISIDHATAASGCLEMAGGFHKRGMVGQEWAPLTEEQMQGMRFEPLETEPGDAVFFDSFAPHRSGPNLTEKPRRVLYITYNKHSEGEHLAQYYADKRNSYPPDIEREPGHDYRFRV